MNNTDLRPLNEEEVYYLFRGMFYVLSPLQISLSIVILVQNTVISRSYYPDRANFVPGLFMRIGLADILRAQGDLVLAVISNLVYSGCLESSVMYRSLVFYLITAVPGINFSKLFNLVLTITLTRNIVDPFHVIDTARLTKIVRLLCLVITFLHISDAITAIIILKFDGHKMHHKANKYLLSILGSQIPGSIMAATALCHRDGTGYSKCTENHLPGLIIGGVLFCLYFLVPPLTVFICMVVQVRYLRRSLPEEETGLISSQHVSSRVSTSRHVSTTVFLVSSLFFFCNVSYFAFVVGWGVSHRDLDPDKHGDHYFVDIGRQVRYTSNANCKNLFIILPFLKCW